jgi:UDP-N-acetylglucosamine--N-acetylmuramyl-(pentapeptide) pyrophosphoryl-undecaprenol N-acetylglucosamine transferase
MNILIVCGGTGGHLFPGIAVGEELLARGHSVMLVVSEKEVDLRIVERTRGFQAETLPAIGWRGVRPDLVVRFGVAMVRALFRTRGIFRRFRPDAVLGMGGFSSVAPLLCARLAGVPSVIHESNAIAGKANRLAARIATGVAVGVEPAQDFFPLHKTICTGTPVRAFLRKTMDPAAARAALSLEPGLPTVLIMGGSQGARGLNRIVTEAAARISAPEIQWLHLAGAGEEESVREAYARQNRKARVIAFGVEMDQLYGAADLIIARSGASSLAEIAGQALPSILVPYPFAADNHQQANAAIMEKTGAALVCDEKKADIDRLAEQIREVLTNTARRQAMREATKRLRHTDAHVKLADMVERLAGC